MLLYSSPCSSTLSPPLLHRHRHRHRHRHSSPLSNPLLSLLSHKPSRKSSSPPPLAAAPTPAVDQQGVDDGPIELPPSTGGSTLFAFDDNPTPLQTATSVLLTGAITVFLFRSLRRRAKRAKELRVRSSGVNKTKDLKEEALDNLKAMGAAPLERDKPPSPIQALLGGIAAGVIALILYKFTTTIEASLNRQAVSDNFSARQITVTIRTIINGLCYLATCVFGVNSIGLILYSIQLTFNSITESVSGNSASGKNNEEQLNAVGSNKISADNSEQRSDEVKGDSDGT